MAFATQFLAFSSVMLYIVIVPMDVYAAYEHYDTLTFGVTTYGFYYFLYTTMIVLVSFGLPFAYYYAEDAIERDEVDLKLGLGLDDEQDSDDDQNERIFKEYSAE